MIIYFCIALCTALASFGLALHPTKAEYKVAAIASVIVGLVWPLFYLTGLPAIFSRSFRREWAAGWYVYLPAMVVFGIRKLLGRNTCKR